MFMLELRKHKHQKRPFNIKHSDCFEHFLHDDRLPSEQSAWLEWEDFLQSIVLGLVEVI